MGWRISFFCQVRGIELVLFVFLDGGWDGRNERRFVRCFDEKDRMVVG